MKDDWLEIINAIKMKFIIQLAKIIQNMIHALIMSQTIKIDNYNKSNNSSSNKDKLLCNVLV